MSCKTEQRSTDEGVFAVIPFSRARENRSFESRLQRYLALLSGAAQGTPGHVRWETLVSVIHRESLSIEPVDQWRLRRHR